MAMQNMLLVTNNILPHWTCLKPWGMIFNKHQKIFFASTNGAATNRFLYLHLIEQKHCC
jgi:hypothetical protein